MGLFSSSSKTQNQTNQTSLAATDDSAVKYFSLSGSNNNIVDPGAFELARVAVESGVDIFGRNSENFDTVVGFAQQIENNRAKETEGYRDQLERSASEAIQRTGAAIQTAFQTDEGAIDPIKIFAGAGILIGLWIWRSSR